MHLCKLDLVINMFNFGYTQVKIQYLIGASLNISLLWLGLFICCGQGQLQFLSIWSPNPNKLRRLISHSFHLWLNILIQQQEIKLAVKWHEISIKLSHWPFSLCFCRNTVSGFWGNDLWPSSSQWSDDKETGLLSHSGSQRPNSKPSRNRPQQNARHRNPAAEGLPTSRNTSPCR